MREAEIAKRDERYQERKPIPRKYLTLLYLAVVAFFIFTLITKSNLFLFLFLTSLSTIINYETNMTSMRFNPQPEVFSGLILARFVGFPATVFMLILPTFLVDIYTARLDKDTFVSLVLTIIISYLITKFMPVSFLFFAVLLVTLKFIVGLVINMVIGISLPEILFEHVLGFIVNLLLFLAFGNFFYLLFYH